MKKTKRELETNWKELKQFVYEMSVQAKYFGGQTGTYNKLSEVVKKMEALERPKGIDTTEQPKPKKGAPHEPNI